MTHPRAQDGTSICEYGPDWDGCKHCEKNLRSIALAIAVMILTAVFAAGFFLGVTIEMWAGR